MTKECYEKMTEPFRRVPGRAQLLHKINQISTIIIMMAYAGLLGIELWQKNADLVRNIIVPLDSFVIVSVFRCLVNRKRPYEIFGLKPVIPKATRGKSFPSRHVFSAFVIAVTFLWNTPWLWAGVLLLVLAAVIAVIRVISGVHFISDVLAGAFCGIAAGLAGYILL